MQTLTMNQIEQISGGFSAGEYFGMGVATLGALPVCVTSTALIGAGVITYTLGHVTGLSSLEQAANYPLAAGQTLASYYFSHSSDIIEFFA
ncbi:hypothetical protein [uncultured Shewanella sp.]|uniref:hypothetical protein n=1 Tax=uncultured Shewanella sp. TaxID=173975 RepID=UPI002606C915|nr:hypothetical protein [uncultured Shewanella sp.]